MDIVYKSLKHLVKIIFIFFCFSLYPGYAQTEDPFDIQTEIIPSDIQQKENEENLFKIRAEVLPAEISPGEEAIFTVTFEIAAGYYLYADKTDITPKPVSGLIFGKIKKPEGIKKENPYLGTIFMYEGHIAIQIPVLAEKSVGLGKKTCFFYNRLSGMQSENVFSAAAETDEC